uniref:Uncharacterized protein n=1 Tax=Vitis vinifera TaxID=29760 RepID=A5AMR6_VITVI|nr:hypothetical protein VITISV_006315 [Vitis vinifera]
MDSQRGRHVVLEDMPSDIVTPLVIPVQMPATQTVHTISRDQATVIPPTITPVTIIEDPRSRMDKLERRIGQMRDPDEVISWDDLDDMPVATLPVGFRMPNIERYTSVGCPHTEGRELVDHLRAMEAYVLRTFSIDDLIIIPMRDHCRYPGVIIIPLHHRQSSSSSAMVGHRTDYCASLRHTIQDLIDSGAVSFPVSTTDTDLGPDMTADSFPAYSTHAVPPPSGLYHHVECEEFEPMVVLSWRGATYDLWVAYDMRVGRLLDEVVTYFAVSIEIDIV